MVILKYVHTGGIKVDDHIIFVTTSSSRQKIIYQLNTWLFDHLYANKENIQQLPPMDDWTRSHEDLHRWDLKFLDKWNIWITQEQLEFK